jgi:hypothetical protein
MQKLDRRQRNLVNLGLLLLIFLTAFAIRVHHPVSRAVHWHKRGHVFGQAIRYQVWEDTYLQYHPGVTTMAVAAFGQAAYHKVRNADSWIYAPAQWLYDWAIPEGTTDMGRDVAGEGVVMSALLSALIILVVLAINRLEGRRLIGYIAGGLLTFSPNVLMQSRSIHVDALLSSFMLLSALLLFLYQKEKRLFWLLLSGFVCGLALLTKTSALFLLPFFGLTTGVYTLLDILPEWSSHQKNRIGWLASKAWIGIIRPGLIWLVMAGIPFLFWPAVWVKPFFVFDELFLGVFRHATESHVNRRFFWGRWFDHGDAPYRFFYLVAIPYNTTFVVLTLFCAALIFYLRRRKQPDLPADPVRFWLLIAYCGFYTLEVTLSSWQDQRYVTPVVMVMIVVAAVGLAAVVDLVAAAFEGKRQAWRTTGIALLAVGLQAVAALPYAPHYGAHLNHLLGGNLLAQKAITLGDQHEGILYAVDYIKANSEEGAIIASPTRLFPSLEQYFEDVDVVYMSSADVDFYIFPIVVRQRRYLLDQWEEIWDSYQDQTPELIVYFDGVEYLRVHAADPDLDLPHVEIHRGGVWLIVLAWVWAIALAALVVLSIRRINSQEMAL